MPISAGVCMFQPGSVKSGGTWQVAQRALPSKSVLPRVGRRGVEAARAAASGAASASW